MVGLKKFLRDELVHLTIVLSLLRIDPYHVDLERADLYGFGVEMMVIGSSSAGAFTYRDARNGLPRGHVLAPKNLLQETMLLSQRDIFYELNSLGRYDRYSRNALSPRSEVTTYLLCGQELMSAVVDQSPDPTDQNSATVSPDGSPVVAEAAADAQAQATVAVTLSPDSFVGDARHNDVTSQGDSAQSENVPMDCVANVGDMSKEDMDLIEILLRQDIDLGVTRDVFDVQLRKEVLAEEPDSLLIEVKNKDEKQADVDVDDVLDPWSGLNYTIDSETGEHVVLDDPEEAGPSSDTGSVFLGTPLSTSDLLSFAEELDTIPLEDLSLVGTKEDNQEKLEDKDSGGEEVDLDLPLLDNEDSFAEELKELEDMIQSAQLHHGGGRLQPRVQYLRSVSMEQRWQDLTNFLSYPPPTTSAEAELHHHHHHHHHHHNMGMGMLHNGSATVGGPAAVHGHVVAQHNYTLPNYGIDNRTSSVLIQNATLPPPVADINSNMSYPGEVGDPTNVGAAVVTSMSTLTNGSDSMADTAPHSHYQMDAGTMMFPGNHTEVNQTTEGFLSSILNDEDLQLMDMAMNEGMYTMRMLENDDAMDTSSDSAVSSMASSERVPSISDGVTTAEWMETAAGGSPHPVEEQEQRYYGMEHKYRSYNYSYAPGMAPSSHLRPNHPGSGSGGGSGSGSGGGGGGGVGANDVNNGATVMDRRMPPVAQKKYQLFGKRVGMEQPMGGVTYGALPRGSASMPQPTAPMKYPGYLYPGMQDHNSSSSYGSLEGATAPNTSVGPAETKYSCSLEFARQHTVGGSPASLNHIQHNHTYQLPSNGVADPQRPTVRDKQKKAAAAAAALAAGEDHLPRDEKRARAMKIPLTTDEIINLPMDEFNERLSKYDLTEPQLALIRDIRRRGKNKVAAQNCRKRKLDQILTLAEEVQRMHHEREHLMQQQQSFINERQRMKDKFSQLYRHVFQSLRDPDGNPYSPYEYSLQQAADGNILLVPRNGTVNMELQEACKAKSKGGRREDGKK